MQMRANFETRRLSLADVSAILRRVDTPSMSSEYRIKMFQEQYLSKGRKIGEMSKVSLPNSEEGGRSLECNTGTKLFLA